MNNRTRTLFTAILVLAITAAVNGQVITLDFEDLTGYGSLPTDYAELTWDPGWQYTDYQQDGINNPPGLVRIGGG